MSGARLFERYLVVDWSANGQPKRGRDSIWIAMADRAGPIEVTNPATRRRAESAVSSLLDSGRRDRTLIAVDASLGFPVGTAEWFGLHGTSPWRAMWQHLERRLVDDERNRNDRFAVAAELNRLREPGPFWGCPAGSDVDGLSRYKPASFPIAEFRNVELALRNEGFRPASVWQLLGAGSVGSQTLTLLPVLERLFRRGGVEVWPFTTGLVAPRVEAGTTVVIEIWPTVFPVDQDALTVRDAAQVASVARCLRECDDRSELSRWFEPVLHDDVREAVEAEEGWLVRPRTA